MYIFNYLIYLGGRNVRECVAHKSWIKLIFYFLKQILDARFNRILQECLILFKVAAPLARLHEGELAEERAGADAEDVLQDAALVVGQPPAAEPEPGVQHGVRSLG